eukprot:Skav218887  [mRNA]  locus=scaffold328:67659:72596:- [translate_table: standard]
MGSNGLQGLQQTLLLWIKAVTAVEVANAARQLSDGPGRLPGHQRVTALGRRQQAQHGPSTFRLAVEMDGQRKIARLDENHGCQNVGYTTIKALLKQ